MQSVALRAPSIGGETNVFHLPHVMQFIKWNGTSLVIHCVESVEMKCANTFSRV